MKKIIFEGCATAIATPFTENGVNIQEFKRLVENQIKNHIDGLVVCGTTGEATTMSMEEKIDTIKAAVEVSNGRVPIIAGTGANDTKKAIEMSKKAEELGVDALLIVTPYYNKCTQKGLIEHYKAIAKEVKLPIIIYSVKSRTGVNILPETCLELSKIDNIVAIKEASGDLSQVAEIANLCRDNLIIYSGNDDQVLPVLSLGGKGVISVLSNVFPKETHDMVCNFFEGNISEAIKMQLDFIPVINSLFCEVNPIPVKEALNYIGYEFGNPRLPLTPMEEKNRKIMIDNIEKIRNN